MSPTINLTSGGLAINPVMGIMYATGGNGFQSTGLFTIDKNTGAATLVGQGGGECCTAPFGFNSNVPVYSGGSNRAILPFPSTSTFYRLKTL